VRRRHADDRIIVVYRTPLLVRCSCSPASRSCPRVLDVPLPGGARGAVLRRDGFLITSGIVNGTFTRSLVERAVQVVALGAIGVAVVGIVELAMKVGARGDTLVAGWLAGPGITATLGSPLVLATYLVLGVPALLYQLTVAEEGPERDFWMAGSTIAFVGILLTKSPVGMVAISVSALSGGGGASSRAPWSPAAWCCSLHLSLGARDVRRLAGLALRPRRRALQHARAGELAPAPPRHRRAHARRAGAGREVLDPERSSFHIRLLVETGILGWLGILWVLATALVSLYRAQRDVSDPRLQALLWAVFCSVVGFVITLQSFSAFENLTLQVFFWGVLGIGVGRGRPLRLTAARIRRRREARTLSDS
jgi:hypothetical protein